MQKQRRQTNVDRGDSADVELPSQHGMILRGEGHIQIQNLKKPRFWSLGTKLTWHVYLILQTLLCIKDKGQANKSTIWIVTVLYRVIILTEWDHTHWTLLEELIR